MTLIVPAYLRALSSATRCAEQHHVVALQVLQQTLLQPPHREALPLLQHGVVARGEGQAVVRVHLQVSEVSLFSPSVALVVQVPGQEGGHGQRVQGGGGGRLRRRRGHRRQRRRGVRKRRTGSQRGLG